VAVVATLRAVGHVAKGVDGPRDEHVKRALEVELASLTRTKPEPPIYWNFIADERNRVLKEMDFGARMNIVVRPGTGWWNAQTGDTGGDDGGPTAYDQFMHGGIYDGKDPRDLCREAIAFWGAHLDRVDERASETRGRPAV
jgi:hypothetical protein